MRQRQGQPPGDPRLPRLLASGLLLVAGTGWTAPGGELDAGFGDHGRVVLPDPPLDLMGAIAAFEEPGSAKLLVVTAGWNEPKLLRFDRDGALDAAFGNGGWLPLDVGGDSVSINTVHRLPDGKLLIAGDLNVYGDPTNTIHGSALLARFNPDGSPDVTFGTLGRAPFAQSGQYEVLLGMTVQGDGRIVVVGDRSPYDSAGTFVARFTPDGQPDPSFGPSTAGEVVELGFVRPNDALAKLVRQADEKLVLCGTASTGTSASALLAIRLHPDGTPDSGFGKDGVVRTGRTPSAANDCLALPDGRLALAGSRGEGELQRAAIARLDANGRLDSGFGNEGIRVISTALPSVARTLAVLADGSYAVAGSHGHPEQYDMFPRDDGYLWSYLLHARVDAVSGALDPQFGHLGTTSVDLSSPVYRGSAFPVQVLEQSDGKWLTVGMRIDRNDWYYWPTIALARIDPQGPGSNGWAALAEAHADVDEGDIEIHFPVRRTGGSTGTLSVDYRTVDNSAVAGSDYVAANGTPTWPDGDMSDRTIAITIKSDDGSESNFEYFGLELFNSTGGLALAHATVGIRSVQAGNPPGLPPANPPANPSAGGTRGGGAAGFGLSLLLVLFIVGRALRGGPGAHSRKRLRARLEW